MKFKPSISKRSWIVLATLLIVGLLFGLYFGIYIPNRAKRITAEKFRQIDNISENISAYFFNLYKQEALSNTDSDKLAKKVVDARDTWFKNAVTQYLNLWQEEGKFDEIILMSKTDVIYQSSSNEVSFSSDTSLMSLKGGLKTTGVSDVFISETPYKAFTTHFSIDDVIGLDEDHDSFFLTGLITAQEFIKLSREVPRWYLVQASIILIILLMSMPWIKLMSMNEIERLYRSNIVWLTVASVLGIGMIVLVYSAHYVRLKSIYHLEADLRNLSQQVEDTFMHEIRTKVSALRTLDSKLWNFKSTINGINRSSEVVPSSRRVDSIEISTKVDTITDSIVMASGQIEKIYQQSAHLSNWKSLIWMDQNGYARTILFPEDREDSDPIYPLLLDSRDYFKNTVRGEYWYLDTVPFVLQSIRSWKDQALEGMIAIPTQSLQRYNGDTTYLTVVAMGSRFSSVMDQVLSPGYSFAVIDEGGGVLFHSDARKNLQENFLEETRYSKDVQAAIQGRTDRTFRMLYQDRNYQAHISPVTTLPLSIVTYYDLAYEYLPISQIIFVVFVMLILLLLLLSLQIGLLYLLKFRPTKLRKRGFLLDFLTPFRCAASDLFMVNITLLFVLIYMVILSLLVYYFSNQFEYSIAPLFILFVSKVYLFEFIHRNLDKSDNRRVVRQFRLVSYVLIFVLNAYYFFYFHMHMQLVIGCQMVLFLVVEYFSAKRNLGSTLYDRWREVCLGKLLSQHSTFCVLLLVFISVSSVYFCYKFASRTERLLWTKYSQLETARSREVAEDGLEYSGKTLYNLFSDSSTLSQFKTDYKRVVSYLNNSIRQVDSVSSAGWIPIDYRIYGNTSENELAQTIQEELVLGSHELLRKVHAYVRQSASDGSYEWGLNELDNNVFYLRYRAKDGEEFYFSSTLSSPKGKLIFKVGFSVAILLTLLGIYYLIQYSGFRIYSPSFRNFVSPKEIELSFLKDCNNKRVFLIDMPYSTMRDVLHKYSTSLRDRGILYGTLSFKDIGKQDFETQLNEVVRHRQVVIINDFSFKSNNHNVWDQKLDILEDLTQDPNKQIILVSETHPHMVVKFYEIMISKSYDKQWTKDFRNEYQSYRHAKTQWQQFFTGFVKIYEPLREDVDFRTSLDQGSEKIIRTISDELRFGTYLRTLDPLIRTYCSSLKTEKKCLDEEDIILKIQNLAELYYYSIWSSLSKDEKFLVYDLAIDGFVNTKNDQAIRILMQKGILKWKKGFELMNQSFNNFVLTVVDKEMDRSMRKEMLRKGNWSVLQLVILILLVSIGIFLLLGNQHLVSNIQAALTAIVAVGGLLLRFQGILGSFSGAKQPS